VSVDVSLQVEILGLVAIICFASQVYEIETKSNSMGYLNVNRLKKVDL
jgi:hypothetical protein